MVELGVVVFEVEDFVEADSAEAQEAFEWGVPGLVEHHLDELEPGE